jgi:hypothetical protein
VKPAPPAKAGRSSTNAAPSEKVVPSKSSARSAATNGASEAAARGDAYLPALPVDDDDISRLLAGLGGGNDQKTAPSGQAAPGGLAGKSSSSRGRAQAADARTADALTNGASALDESDFGSLLDSQPPIGSAAS